MNKAYVSLSFVAGALIGAVTAVLLTKDYYEKKAEGRADAEIESVKEMMKRREERLETITNEQVEKRAYEIIAERYEKPGFKEKEKKKEEETMAEERPYVIDPSEYGDLDYKQVSLNYYDDGVLTYENDDVIDDVDSLVGKDSLSHFGEYEADTVYVRNDRLKIDFEILADTRRYEDIYC